MSDAEKEIDNSKVDEKEIDNSKVDKNLPFFSSFYTPVEKMVIEYNKYTCDDEKKKKSLFFKFLNIEFYYKLLNNYKKYGSAITECEEYNIKRKINLSKLEKEVTYTEKEVEFLINLFMNCIGENWNVDDEEGIIKLKEYKKFPIHVQIKDMAELENEYYKIRPKKYIERSLSDDYHLNINYF